MRNRHACQRDTAQRQRARLTNEFEFHEHSPLNLTAVLSPVDAYFIDRDAHLKQMLIRDDTDDFFGTSSTSPSAPGQDAAQYLIDVAATPLIPAGHFDRTPR